MNISFSASSTISQQLTTQLRSHKDLGLHTECFGDGEIDLVRLGVINNCFKTVMRGRIVASYVIGTKKTFSFINENPLVGKPSVWWVVYLAVTQSNRRRLTLLHHSMNV